MALNIPESFTNSVVLSSFAFAFATWLMFHFTLRSLPMPNKRRWTISISIAVILLAWFSFVVFLGKAGIFAINPLVAPFILIGFIVLFGVLQKVYASKSVQRIADAVPQHWLVAIQTYRIVGVGFLILMAQGFLPAEFALPSGIGDIIVGITAPFVAILLYLKKPYAKKVGIAWNILGIADLVVALSAGMLGFPRPIQTLPFAPSTEPLSLYPLSLITLFAVPLALLMHFFSLRVLRKN